MHFLTELVLAAPASGLPSLLTAFASQACMVCADAGAVMEPSANTDTNTANANTFIVFPPSLSSNAHLRQALAREALGSRRGHGATRRGLRCRLRRATRHCASPRGWAPARNIARSACERCAKYPDRRSDYSPNR